MTNPTSSCCGAPTIIGGIGDFHDKDKVSTRYYVCTKCEKACDLTPCDGDCVMHGEDVPCKECFERVNGSTKEESTEASPSGGSGARLNYTSQAETLSPDEKEESKLVMSFLSGVFSGMVLIWAMNTVATRYEVSMQTELLQEIVTILSHPTLQND